MSLAVAQEGSPAGGALRHRQTVQQLVGQSAPVGGLPGSNVNLRDPRRVLPFGPANLHSAHLPGAARTARMNSPFASV